MQKSDVSNISFRQLEALVAIAEHGTFEAAASRLNTTQSAVSKRIREFENACGTQLFLRTGRPSTLTKVGEVVVRHATALLDGRAALLRQMSPDLDVERRLRVGLTSICAETWLPFFVSAARKQYPALHLEADVGNSTTLCEMLGRGKIDLAVLPQHAAPLEYIQVGLPHPAKFLWMCSPGFSAPHSRMSLNRLAELPIILQSRSTQSDVVFGRWLSEQGIRLPHVVYSNSMLSVRALALAGGGVAYLPSGWCRGHVASGLLRILDVRPTLPLVPFAIIHKSSVQTPFIEEMTRLIAIHCDFELSCFDHHAQ